MDFDCQKRAHWLPERPGVAGVLLLGWLFFWVAAIVQPCCRAFADEGAHVAQVAPGANGALDDLHESPGHGDPCPQLISSDLVLAEQISMPSAGADYVPHWLVASYTELMPVASEIPSSFVLDDPPPPSRLYLRLQRLLI